MTYLQTHRRPYQQQRRALVIIGGVIVVVVGVMHVTLPHLFPAFFTAIARPFWRTEFSIENGALNSPAKLLADNQSLLRQLDEARIRLDTIGAVESENRELKVLLGRGTTTPVRNPGILAAVLMRPPLSAYDELIIDIGRDHALATSSLVYVPGDILVGRVVDVLGTTAKVTLFSSAGESYPVLIGQTHAAATAVGRGGGHYEAQVSRDTAVIEGDFVLNAGFSNKPFGIVSAVLLDPTQPFKTVLFAPPVNIYQLRWVVVKNRE